MKFKDLTGQRFGRLIVMERLPARHKKTQWRCLCDCGQETEASTDHLTGGHTSSCGCLRYERLKEANTTHGERDTRLYNIWVHIRQRCGNPQNKNFMYYGGRGVRVCIEWRDSFEAFRAWALANGYRDDLTIDRIDANGNYEPSNCRWLTQAEQNRNRRYCKKEVIL